jgi:hypothetical protein
MPVVSVIVPTCNRRGAVQHNSRKIAGVHDCRFSTLEQGNRSVTSVSHVRTASGLLSLMTTIYGCRIGCIEFYTDAKTCPPEILRPGQHSRDKIEINAFAGREIFKRNH